MKPPNYRDRDYAFGQVILTLRTTIGLTQAGLATVLGISRRSLADWEASVKYPRPEHLKAFITFAVQRHAFRAGEARQHIRDLWQLSRQKMLLDETWLTALLTSSDAQPPTAPPLADSLSPLLPTRDDQIEPSARSQRVEWGDALAVPALYGREWELPLLSDWIVTERCRVVSVLGLGGIGKSSLAVTLMHHVAPHFDVVIWRSLRDIPTCDVLLDDMLHVLAASAVGDSLISFDQRLSLLLEYMRRLRVLLVLDNVESVLGEGEQIGQVHPVFVGFERFLRQIASTQHQSCLLLTSRDKPDELLPHEGKISPVRALRLARLDSEACLTLLAEKDLVGSAVERTQLIEAYAGNPLALKIVAQTIVDLFDGEIALFLAQGEVVFGGIRDLLAEQFQRLPTVEQKVVIGLAIIRGMATLDELKAMSLTPVTPARLLEALERLYHCSLIERGHKQGSFALQPIMRDYVVTHFIDKSS